MDIDINETVSQFVQGFIYDFIKAVMGYIFGRILFERVLKRRRWSRWRIRLLRDSEQLVDRQLSAQVAERVVGDPSELSVFVKGVVSPYAKLNMDIVAQDSFSMGLLRIDKRERTITVDLDKNPAPSSAAQRSPGGCSEL